MKVALVSCSTVRHMPYIEFYKDILNSLNIEYIIINEHEQEEYLPDNHYAYNVPSQGSIIGKIKKFFGWRSFVKKTMKQNSVQYAIILTTWPGVKMVDFWSGKFKNKYILDIRDFSSEGIKLYSMCVNRLVKKSSMTVISSEKFKTWLVDSPKISVAHNMPINYTENDSVTLKKGLPFTIGYVGLVNYEKQNCALLDAFAKDENVKLVYKGTIEKSCHIKEYCETANMKNVIFTGRYNNSEKQYLYNDIDMINAIYGNNSLVVTTALPNKLYDCIIYKKPMLASKGTYLGELVEKYHIGLAIDTEKDDISTNIHEYVNDFDEKLFLAGCQELLEKVKREHHDTIEKIKSVFVD